MSDKTCDTCSMGTQYVPCGYWISGRNHEDCDCWEANKEITLAKERDDLKAELAALRAKLKESEEVYDGLRQWMHDSLEHEDEGQDDLTAAIEYAAKELPEGWKIVVGVYKGDSRSVLNVRYKNRIHLVCFPDDTLPQQLRAAVDFAKKEE